MKDPKFRPTSQIALVGAYGRVYRNKDAALKDWLNGKDFKIDGGPYCSVRDLIFLEENYSQVCICTDLGYVKVV